MIFSTASAAAQTRPAVPFVVLESTRMSDTDPFIHMNVLDAYRADLARSERTSLGEADEQCLVFATLLNHAIAMPYGDREEYLAKAFAAATCPIDELVVEPTADVFRSIAATAYLLAEYAERCGGFAVATTVADLAQGVVAGREPGLTGRLLYVQARIFRKLGHLDGALDLLTRLERLGRETDDADLRALASLGKAGVARVRGNHPMARKYLTAALEIAPDTSPELDIALHANHGMLIASATAGDFDSAIRHGAAALQAVTAHDQRVELLANLAAACFDAGEAQAALHGYLQALAETTDGRVRVACIGGGAIAAASVGRDDIARRLIALGEAIGGRQRDLVHEVADLYRELHIAATMIGDEGSARGFRDEAERLARRHGFFEILHRLEAEPQRRAPKPLAREARDIAASLAASDPEPLLALATSIDPLGVVYPEQSP